MSEVDSNDVAIEDVREILAALGLGTHARPYSAHDVVQREVLPALRRLRAVVERVEALAAREVPGDRWHDEPQPAYVRATAIRRALDGET